MDFDKLDRTLREFAADRALANDERFELRNIGAQASVEQVRFLRNRAFAIARESVGADSTSAPEMLRWLEQVVRTLDISTVAAVVTTSVCFSPGDDCLRKLRELCRQARNTLDACVFTIADDRLTEELVAAHARGVRVRIVSDDDKRHDDGSDIERLRDAGVGVRLDRTRFHMHHKFAVFDGKTVANGSFNWTRTASTSNFENLVVSTDTYLCRVLSEHFEHLWEAFAPQAA